jgi:hypothetical protein
MKKLAYVISFLIIIGIGWLVFGMNHAEFVYNDKDLMSNAIVDMELGSEKNFAAEMIDVKAIQYDVGLLRYAILHAYAGRHTINQTLLNQLDHDLEAFAMGAKPMKREALAAALQGFIDAIPDAHFSITGSYQTLHYFQSLVQKKKQHGLLHPSSQKPMTLNSLGSVKSLYAGGDQHKRVVLAKLNYFPFHEGPGVRKAYMAFYKKLAQHLKGSYALIFDLRGNPGGDSSPFEAFMQILIGSHNGDNFIADKLIDVSQGSLAVNRSPINRISKPKFLADLAKAQAQANHALLACVKSYYAYEYCDQMQGISEAYTEIAPDLWSKTSKTRTQLYYGEELQHHYNRMVYVLQDRHTASTAEMAIQILKANYPYLITVGQFTGGYLHFGDIVHLVLPRAKLAVVMPTAIFKFYPEYEDKKGIPPQVVVPEGDDSMAVAMKMIASYGQEDEVFVSQLQDVLN